MHIIKQLTSVILILFFSPCTPSKKEQLCDRLNRLSHELDKTILARTARSISPQENAQKIFFISDELKKIANELDQLQ